MSAKTDSGSVVKKEKKRTASGKIAIQSFCGECGGCHLRHPAIAKFIQEGSISVTDGVLRVSPSIQHDEAFTWWLPSSCKKCRSDRSNESSESPPSHLANGSCMKIARKRCLELSVQNGKECSVSLRRKPTFYKTTGVLFDNLLKIDAW
uniref:Uncharacterized protein n=1 Tax=Ditylenchus dipsaci TaxID=166011 RepID=A0A915EQH3_9BILA